VADIRQTLAISGHARMRDKVVRNLDASRRFMAIALAFSCERT
jgi:hypothetical protein